MKRMKLNSHENNMNEKPSCSKGNIHKKPLPFDDYKDKLTKQQGVADVKLNEFELKLAEMQKVLREKEEEHEEMRRRLEAEKQERENQTLQMKEKLKEKEVQLENQTSELREMLKEKEEELNSELQKREVAFHLCLCVCSSHKDVPCKSTWYTLNISSDKCYRICSWIQIT